VSTSKNAQRTDRAQKVAEMRAAQARAERRRRLGVAGAVVLAVVLVAGVLVYLGLNSSGPGNARASTGSTSASAAVAKKVAAVPASTLDAVGTGTATASITAISAPPLTAGGKPRVLYVGAEYCPYCAAQRWPLTVALSRFGSFSGLAETHSASQDVFPDTPTLSFHGSSYTSDYLSFTGIETTSNKRTANGYAPLDTLSDADQKVVDTYNAPPYVKGGGGAIPFIDLAGRYVSSGASFSPDLLAGRTQAQVADALADPSSPIAQAVDGAANSYTAALCELTGGKPAAVCTSKGVTAAAGTVQGQ
jgi:hypothetical protein